MDSWLDRQGLDQCGKPSGNGRSLRWLKKRHPAGELIYGCNRLLNIRDETLLRPNIVGADGRVHPDYRQLGTHTGRQTSRRPNIQGLDSVLRPLVVPEPGRGIGEVDLAQIEVGIAGAVYGDRELIRMFNAGDVYSAMAQDFYREELPAVDRSLTGDQFKEKYPELRARMKTCTLGLIYGITPSGLAPKLGTTVRQAADLQKQFQSMFPELSAAIAKAVAGGAVKGAVAAVSGLCRYRGREGHPNNWERRWMANFPVQGSAAVVFKAAGNRLDRVYRKHDAWIIVPLHDAFIFEAPLDVLGDVARLTEQVMCETVREYYPELEPRAVVNIRHPECWNKDGQIDICQVIERLVGEAKSE